MQVEGPAPRLPALGDQLHLHGPLGRGRRRRADPRPAAETHPPRNGPSLGAVATVIDSQSVNAAEIVGRDSRGYDGPKKTSDAKNESSSQGKVGFSRGREGHGLVERDAVRQAVVKAADHPVEKVPLGGCVAVSGFTSTVVVGPRAV